MLLEQHTLYDLNEAVAAANPTALLQRMRPCYLLYALYFKEHHSTDVRQGHRKRAHQLKREPISGQRAIGAMTGLHAQVGAGKCGHQGLTPNVIIGGERHEQKDARRNNSHGSERGNVNMRSQWHSTPKKAHCDLHKNCADEQNKQRIRDAATEEATNSPWSVGAPQERAPSNAQHEKENAAR